MADSTLATMTAASALDGTELYYGLQGSADRKVTGAQIKTLVGGRTVLTADTTFYVATTGNDTTGDGSSGNPWATIQRAVNYVMFNVVGQNCNVTISVADGTYAENLFLGPTQIGPDAYDAVAISFGSASLVPTTGSYSSATITCQDSYWQIKIGTALTVSAGSGGNTEAVAAFHRGFPRFSGSDLHFDGNFGVLFDAEGWSLIELSDVRGTMDCNGTIGSIVNCYNTGDVQLYSLDFTVDPGLASGVAQMQTNCFFGLESGFTGTAAASPGNSSIEIGSVVIDPSNFFPPSQYVCDNSSAYNGLVGGGPFTVATLPSASTFGAGARQFVTDALTPVFGSPVAGSGAVKSPVYSDGSTWIVG